MRRKKYKSFLFPSPDNWRLSGRYKIVKESCVYKTKIKIILWREDSCYVNCFVP